MPRIEKGFRITMEDTGAAKGYVIAQIDKGFPMGDHIWAMPLHEFLGLFYKNEPPSII